MTCSQKSDVDEQPRPQPFIGIVEDGLVGDRRRRRVDLIVDHRELAGREVLPVGALGNDFDVALSQLGANLGERGRGQRKADPDRADLLIVTIPVVSVACTMLPRSTRRVRRGRR